MGEYRKLFVFRTSDKNATTHKGCCGFFYEADKESVDFPGTEKAILLGSVIYHKNEGKSNYRSFPVYPSECIFEQNSVLNNIVVKERMFYGEI